MALGGRQMLVDGGEQVAAIARTVAGGAAHEDLLAIEVVAIELDAQLLAVVEPECRLLTHATTVSHGAGGAKRPRKRD
ncbi:MAG: hypothetical protein ACR2KV_01460 [Solirubrobacteraceae bacterium]